MALIGCIECGKEISSRATSCPNCGCPVEAIMFEPVASTNQENNDIIKFLDLAQSALNGGNGEEAYCYASKILEINPRNTVALEVKVLSIQLLSTIGDTRTQEIIECGTKAIECSSEKNKTSVTDKVYTYFLNRALELLTIANLKIREVEEIKQTFQNYALISIFTCGQNTLNADAPFVNIIDSLSNDALSLISSVPQKLIHDIDKFQNLTISIANMYKQYSDGLKERYKIYGASLTEEANNTREKMLQLFFAGQITPQEIEEQKRKAKVQYWVNHPEEKSQLIHQRDFISEHISRLEEELKVLSFFKRKEKSEILSKIENLQQELQQIKSRLE